MMETTAWGAKLLAGPPCFSSCAEFMKLFPGRNDPPQGSLFHSHHTNVHGSRAGLLKQELLGRFPWTPSSCVLSVNVGQKVGREKKSMCNNASGKTDFFLRPYPEFSGSFFDSSHAAALRKTRSWAFREPIKKCFRKSASDSNSLRD